MFQKGSASAALADALSEHQLRVLQQGISAHRKHTALCATRDNPGAKLRRPDGQSAYSIACHRFLRNIGHKTFGTEISGPVVRALKAGLAFEKQLFSGATRGAAWNDRNFCLYERVLRPTTLISRSVAAIKYPGMAGFLIQVCASLHAPPKNSTAITSFIIGY